MDPDYPWFEELDKVDDRFLNSYEVKAGITLNFDYIMNFWKEMESIPYEGNWDIRVDRRESK
jgi:hypothetical protein